MGLPGFGDRLGRWSSVVWLELISVPLIVSDPLIPSGIVRIHSFHSPPILLRLYISTHTSTKLLPRIARSLRSQLTQNIVTFRVYNS